MAVEVVHCECRCLPRGPFTWPHSLALTLRNVQLTEQTSPSRPSTPPNADERLKRCAAAAPNLARTSRWRREVERSEDDVRLTGGRRTHRVLATQQTLGHLGSDRGVGPAGGRSNGALVRCTVLLAFGAPVGRCHDGGCASCNTPRAHRAQSAACTHAESNILQYPARLRSRTGHTFLAVC